MKTFRFACILWVSLHAIPAHAQNFDEIAQHNIHSVLAQKNGEMVIEKYFSGTDKPMGAWFQKEVTFTAEHLHDMRSITKTIVALGVGMAVDAGKLSTAKIVAPSATISIGHLLSMSNGLEWDEAVGTYGTFANDETQLFFRGFNASFVLNRPTLYPPGTRFNYSGGNTFVLAQQLQAAVQIPYADYITKNLFEPLGINQWEWRTDFRGRPVSFAGLRMKPRDLLKIGQLMLQKGRWGERQVISEQWVADSLQPRVRIDAQRQYGYHWYLGELTKNQQTHLWASAVGNGGQRLYIVPSLQIAVVITAGQYNSATIGAVVNKIFFDLVEAM